MGSHRPKSLRRRQGAYRALTGTSHIGIHAGSCEGIDEPVRGMPVTLNQ